MKFVVQNSRLGSMSLGRVLKGLPHIHDGQSDLSALLSAQFLKKEIHTRFRPIFTSEPNRPLPQKITHHNPVGMPLPNRYLVDANHLRTRQPHSFQLFPHVFFFQRLHRLPVQVKLLRYIRNSRIPTATAYIKGKSLGIERVVRKPLESLLLHFLAPSAKNPSDLHLQVNPHVPAGEVPNPSDLPVVEGMMNKAAHSARRFFPLRTSRMTRALGSPKIPETVCWGRKPENRYVSQSLRYRAMENQYHFCNPFPTYESLVPKGYLAYSKTNFTHSIGRRP
jgi:hypothetical protein